MSASLNESQIRGIVDGMRKKHPTINTEDIIKMTRAHMELANLEWNSDLERKIRYCLFVNPNSDSATTLKRGRVEFLL